MGILFIFLQLWNVELVFDSANEAECHWFIVKFFTFLLSSFLPLKKNLRFIT